MGKKAWIIFTVVCVLVVATALVLMLMLVPPKVVSLVQEGTYEPIAKQEYTYSGKQSTTLTKEYTVTEDAVKSGLKTDKYEEGNINPFTPNKDVTIYNEPTKQNENGSPLTPESK